MKSRKVLFTTVLALLCVAAFAVTALAQSAMVGPDENDVYENGEVDVTFNSPTGGGMEGEVSASSNLTFSKISTSNSLAAAISTEDHVFSLFGDPVVYNYQVSGSAGEEVSVSLTNAEESDADGNLTSLDDTTWSATIQQATGSPSSDPSQRPSPGPSSSGDPQPTQRPTSTLPPIPTAEPSGAPDGSGNIIADNNNNNNSNNINSNNNNIYTTINNYSAVRYPAYAPRPVYRRPVSSTYDGMPKMGDSSPTNYWALLTMGALLCVIIIVAATQLYTHSTKNRHVNVTILR